MSQLLNIFQDLCISFLLKTTYLIKEYYIDLYDIIWQIENEFGSYGDDKAYLHHLVTLARGHLGHDVIL